MFSYPSFPQWNGSISNLLLQIILWIVEIPLIAIGNVIIGVSGSVGNSIGSGASTVISFPATIFKQSEASFRAYGVFAPIIVSVIWGASIIILIFFIFKAVQIAGDEMTNEV